MSLWLTSVMISFSLFPISVTSCGIADITSFLSDLSGCMYLKQEALSTTNKAHLTPFKLELQP